MALAPLAVPGCSTLAQVTGAALAPLQASTADSSSSRPWTYEELRLKLRSLDQEYSEILAIARQHGGREYRRQNPDFDARCRRHKKEVYDLMKEVKYWALQGCKTALVERSEAVKQAFLAAWARFVGALGTASELGLQLHLVDRPHDKFKQD
eukprot:tig00020601_g11723.t1